MDKKSVLVERMQEELNLALQGNIEPITGESYMTLQHVYQKLKDSFESTFIPEHILDIFLIQDFPLSKYYDYYIDHDYFQVEVDCSQLCREYALYRECEFIEESVHEKVQDEYKAFMKKVTDLAPYRMGKIISEISSKMQVFSIFRYQE